MRVALPVLLFTLAASVAAVAAPDDKVDRERLKRVVNLPEVGENWWYYSPMLDGRILQGGEEPARVDAATLRSQLGADETDAERWADLAAAWRRAGNAPAAAECVEKAVAINRRRASESPDDGRALASLGLAQFAAGDEAGAERSIAAAEKAPRFAWAGTAAAADLVVLREAAHVAGRPIATLDDLRNWLAESGNASQGDQGPALGAEVVAAAGGRYDEAVAAVEATGAVGPAASSVYLRRMTVRALQRPRGRNADDAESVSCESRKASGAQPTEPFAILLLALDDAMSKPDSKGGRQVEAYAQLPPRARANVVVDLARLHHLAGSDDAATSARAFQAIACVQWFCHHDGDTTVAMLRASIAKEPNLRQSWGALTFVLSQMRKWNDLVDVCREWLARDGSAKRHFMLAKALSLASRAAEAEKEWNAGLALDPADATANLGAATLVIGRAKDDADLREAAEFVRKASAAGGAKDRGGLAACQLWDAVILGLSGDADGAEKAARSLLETYPDWAPPREVLAAIGR